jgi:hypothetical protein
VGTLKHIQQQKNRECSNQLQQSYETKHGLDVYEDAWAIEIS